MDTKIPELSRGGLRKFGLTAAGLIAAVFGLGLPWVYGYTRSWSPWIIAGVFAVWALLLPSSLRLIYRGWMRVALVLGKVNSYVLLSVVFICIVSPAGMLMRMLGYDALQRKFLARASTYRKPSVARRPDAMEKPY